jgi:hypothetical protein
MATAAACCNHIRPPFIDRARERGLCAQQSLRLVLVSIVPSAKDFPSLQCFRFDQVCS